MPVAINGTSGVITGVATGGLPDGIVDTDMLAAGAVTAAKRGTGAILQVVTTTKTDTASEAIAQGAIGSTDLISVSCAAASSSNKLLVIANIQMGMSSTATVGLSLFVGGSQAAYRGDAAGSRQRTSVWGRPGSNTRQYNFGLSYVVTSPSTSSTTYSIRGSHAHDSSQTVYLNYSEHGDANYDAMTASTITVMEIAG
tara:strand:- start:249 stop:842 length:594 start_codon:yes stop_codon:yes gene_type:complete